MELIAAVTVTGVILLITFFIIMNFFSVIIYNKQLNEFPNNIENKSYILQIILSYNEITFVPDLTKLKYLKILKLNNNRINNFKFESNAIKTIGLSNNLLTTACITSPTLLYLDLSNNYLPAVKLNTLYLTLLNLNFNNIADISFVAGMNYLRELYVKNNIICTLPALPKSLMILDITNNKIELFDQNLPNLTELYIAGTKIKKIINVFNNLEIFEY